MHAIGLGAVLCAAWWLWSGHDEALILTFGAFSVLVALGIALRMEIVDRESHPLHLSMKAPGYWAWLAWQIAKANIDVARRLVAPRLVISPTMITLRASQADALGRVIYANSITLTPSTVTVDLEGNLLTVHALTRESAAALEAGEMDRRASAMAGAE